MYSLRLPKNLEHELEKMAKIESKSKAQIIKDALGNYLAAKTSKPTAYELGKEYIGKYASGQSDRSTSYKTIIADKIKAKHRKSQ
ncbi:MAG: hypothetical protein LDLANPLL_02716 [Turneriella sp.]|nr:hypothetical protein [Turneriella sp.]